MNTLTHFEIPSADIKKSKEFYANLFDWEFKYMEEMDYMMFTTQKEDGKPVSGGGIINKQNDRHNVTNYITVDNIDASAKKIEELGGNIVLPKMAVPGMGWFLHFADIDGNILAVWQNDATAK